MPKQEIDGKFMYKYGNILATGQDSPGRPCTAQPELTV